MQNRVEPLYLIINNASGYIGGNNENKYLTLVHTDESKERLKRYEELWSKIIYLIRSINNNIDYYDKKFQIQIQFR